MAKFLQVSLDFGYFYYVRFKSIHVVLEKYHPKSFALKTIIFYKAAFIPLCEIFKIFHFL